MSKPNSFTLSSDFATLKNSELGLTATVTVPSASVVSASSYREWHTDITISEPFAIASCRIASSKNSNKYIIGNATDMLRYTSGGIVSYDIYCFVWRVNSTTVRFQALIQNPYSVSMTCASGDETFSLYMYTFVPPFS